MIGREAEEQGYGTELESQVLSVDVNYISKWKSTLYSFHLLGEIAGIVSPLQKGNEWTLYLPSKMFIKW